MRMRNRTTVLLAVVAAWAVAAVPRAEAGGAEAGIAATAAAWTNAFAAKDAAAIAALYTEDGQLLPPNMAPVTGREAIAEFFTQAFGMGFEAIPLTTLEVADGGDWAIEVARYKVILGGKEVEHGKAIVWWKRVGDGWLLYRDIWNADHPPQPPAPEAEPASSGGE